VITTVDPGLLLYAALGSVVGGGYFAGLWWTLARLRSAKRPAVRLLASFALRAGGVVVVFAFVARAGALPLGAAFVGFLLARALLVRRWGRVP
jgi:F1F0 ATPase subunit 2